MHQVWEAYYTKAQAEAVIRAFECDDPLPPRGRALWICPPGRDAHATCITKSKAKGPDGRLLYHVAVYAAPTANTEA